MTSIDSESEQLSYSYLYNGTLEEQVTVYKRFQNNFEKLEELKQT